ncbi:hypothetical protein NHH88_06655 [Oxalobacteraceae bacterium OTU3CAMAD1]|nr:hypothetical protein NHH88_06655 [Oxalobacteraceae bacterium OTU3CAMAD1]
MAKTNFQYEKRQRELEKKKKADEKARRKAELKANPGLAQEGEVVEDDEEGGESAEAPTE